MNNKTGINRLRELIAESRMEQAYHKKFVEHFEDVREQGLLSEVQLEAAADELYKIVFGSDKEENNS